MSHHTVVYGSSILQGSLCCHIVSDIHHLQTRVVERTQDVRDTHSLRDAFGLLVDLLVKGDIVVVHDVVNWLQALIFEQLLSLLILDQEASLEVVVIFWVTEDFRKVTVVSSIDGYFLVLMSEMEGEWLSFRD